MVNGSGEIVTDPVTLLTNVLGDRLEHWDECFGQACEAEILSFAHVAVGAVADLVPVLGSNGSQSFAPEELPEALHRYVQVSLDGQTCFRGQPKVRVHRPSDPARAEQSSLDHRDLAAAGSILGSIVIQTAKPIESNNRVPTIALGGNGIPGLIFRARPHWVEPVVALRGDPLREDEASAFLRDHGNDQALLTRTVVHLSLLGLRHAPPTGPFVHPMFRTD